MSRLSTAIMGICSVASPVLLAIGIFWDANYMALSLIPAVVVAWMMCNDN